MCRGGFEEPEFDSLLRYSHPWLATILNYWPAAVLLPTILGLIAMFVVVTHFWDHHDERPAR